MFMELKFLMKGCGIQIGQMILINFPFKFVLLSYYGHSRRWNVAMVVDGLVLAMDRRDRKIREKEVEGDICCSK